MLISRRRRRNSSESASAVYLAFTTQPGTSGASPYTLSPQPVVAAKKSKGTTDTAKAGTVTISLVVLTGAASLGGTTTKALSSGVADFSANGLTVTATSTATWYLVATLAGLTGATSVTGTTTVAANSPPNTPTISAGTPTSSGVTLTGSAFSDPDVGDTHAASQWQVTTSADTGYASPVISTGDDATNKTSYAATGLSASTAYIARVRYKDSAGNYSAWSADASFTTSAGATTVVTAHFTGANGTSLNGYTDDTSKVWAAASNGSASNAFQIQSNRAASVDIGAGTSHRTALVESANADCTVSATVTAVTGSRTGLAVRAAASGFGDAQLFVANGTTVFLYNYAGFTLNLISSVAQTVSAGDVLSVVCSGTSITAKVNGTTVLSTTTATGQTNTRHGIIVLESGLYTSTLDDFSVTVP